jgi:predicted RNA-binding protein with PIN domain
MPILIDGHNLLHAVKAMTEGQVLSEVQLCKLIGGYLKQTKQRGEIIFDGRGPLDKSGLAGATNLEVSFSGSATDADTVIENRIKASTAPKRLTVVSNDHRLIKAAKARKAVALTADDFWEKVFKNLTRKWREAEPAAKRTGITNGETEFWLKFFKLDK